METHLEHLSKYCRICGSADRSIDYNPMRKTNSTFITSCIRFLNITCKFDDENQEIFPKYICYICFRKLNFFKSSYDAGKILKKIDVAKFEKHSENCAICELININDKLNNINEETEISTIKQESISIDKANLLEESIDKNYNDLQDKNENFNKSKKRKASQGIQIENVAENSFDLPEKRLRILNTFEINSQKNNINSFDGESIIEEKSSFPFKSSDDSKINNEKNKDSIIESTNNILNINNNTTALTIHIERLKHFCRLCGLLKIDMSKNSGGISKTSKNVSKYFKKLFKITVIDESSIVYPPRVCLDCWKILKTTYTNLCKHIETDCLHLNIAVYLPHKDESCSVCHHTLTNIISYKNLFSPRKQNMTKSCNDLKSKDKYNKVNIPNGYIDSKHDQKELVTENKEENNLSSTEKENFESISNHRVKSVKSLSTKKMLNGDHDISHSAICNNEGILSIKENGNIDDGSNSLSSTKVIKANQLQNVETYSNDIIKARNVINKVLVNVVDKCIHHFDNLTICNIINMDSSTFFSKNEIEDVKKMVYILLKILSALTKEEELEESLTNNDLSEHLNSSTFKKYFKLEDFKNILQILKRLSSSCDYGQIVKNSLEDQEESSKGIKAGEKTTQTLQDSLNLITTIPFDSKNDEHLTQNIDENLSNDLSSIEADVVSYLASNKLLNLNKPVTVQPTQNLHKDVNSQITQNIDVNEQPIQNLNQYINAPSKENINNSDTLQSFQNIGKPVNEQVLHKSVDVEVLENFNVPVYEQTHKSGDVELMTNLNDTVNDQMNKSVKLIEKLDDLVNVQSLQNVDKLVNGKSVHILAQSNKSSTSPQIGSGLKTKKRSHKKGAKVLQLDSDDDDILSPSVVERLKNNNSLTNVSDFNKGNNLVGLVAPIVENESYYLSIPENFTMPFSVKKEIEDDQYSVTKTDISSDSLPLLLESSSVTTISQEDFTKLGDEDTNAISEHNKAFNESNLNFVPLVVKQEKLHMDKTTTKDQDPNKKVILKKHGCLKCGKFFRKPSELLRHMTTHNKPYVCEICDKGFAIMSRLHRHKQTHSSKDNRIFCEICLTFFDSIKNMRTHKSDAHVGQVLYPCLYCSRQFRLFGHRKLHMLSVHSKQVKENGLADLTKNVKRTNKNLAKVKDRSGEKSRNEVHISQKTPIKIEFEGRDIDPSGTSLSSKATGKNEDDKNILLGSKSSTVKFVKCQRLQASKIDNSSYERTPHYSISKDFPSPPNSKNLNKNNEVTLSDLEYGRETIKNKTEDKKKFNKYLLSNSDAIHENKLEEKNSKIVSSKKDKIKNSSPKKTPYKQKPNDKKRSMNSIVLSEGDGEYLSKKKKLGKNSVTKLKEKVGGSKERRIIEFEDSLDMKLVTPPKVLLRRLPGFSGPCEINYYRYNFHDNKHVDVKKMEEKIKVKKLQKNEDSEIATNLNSELVRTDSSKPLSSQQININIQKETENKDITKELKSENEQVKDNGKLKEETYTDKKNNSEVINSNSEVINSNSEVIRSNSEVINPNSEINKSNSEVNSTNSEVNKSNLEVNSTNSEVKSNSEVNKSNLEVNNSNSEVNNSNSEEL